MRLLYASIVFILLCAPLASRAADNAVKSSSGKKAEDITFIAVGDIMLSRGILRMTEKLGNDYPFSEVSTELNKGDIVFGNLESVLGVKRTKTYFQKPFNFIAPPESVLSLKDAGFTVLSLSNNHAMDFGPEPIDETRILLGAAGIAYFGAGQNASEAAEPVYVTVKGVKFAFLGYAIAHDSKVYATSSRAGIISPWDHDRIRRAVKEVRKNADVVVVSLHWGVEYKLLPEKSDVRLAHKIIDWGADLILGHHPHVPQGVEEYKGGLIAYSLGNFVFDQRKPDTLLGLMLKIQFSGSRMLSYEVVPVSRHTTFFPAVANGSERDRILGKLMDISVPLYASARWRGVKDKKAVKGEVMAVKTDNAAPGAKAAVEEAGGAGEAGTEALNRVSSDVVRFAMASGAAASRKTSL
ncbi:MAG: CapA family protein [Deltaproteobacteria bacterium]|nr:CapA family protein [Deltaproteobacteria bacterium]